MAFFKSKFFIIFVIILTVLVCTNIVISSHGPTEKFNSELSYRSNLGKCPTRPAGTMALQVVKAFEHAHSLFRIIFSSPPCKGTVSPDCYDFFSSSSSFMIGSRLIGSKRVSFSPRYDA